MSFWKKFLSRKFLAAVVGAVLGITGNTIGLPPEMIKPLIAVLIAYIAGESAIDIARAIKNKK